MNRSRFLIAAGIALAIVAFVAVLAFGSASNNNQPAAPTVVKVVVAVQDIAMGSPMTAAMVTTEDRPVAESADTFASPDGLEGAVARRTITGGQVLHQADFQSNGAANISQSLRAGLRAIAVPLDKVTAVAYLLQPGDFVDVMIALEDKDDLNPVVQANPRAFIPTSGPDGTTTDTTPYIALDDYANNTSVKVLVQNVQVLAVQEQAAAPISNSVVSSAATGPAFVVVLAVTPEQAELVRFAQLDGNVSLVMRSPADQGTGDVATGGITLHELVEKYGVLPPVPVVP